MEEERIVDKERKKKESPLSLHQKTKNNLPANKK